MSIFRQQQLTCPHCEVGNVETVAVSLHGPRVPEVVERIRAGSFQVFSCAACTQTYRCDGPVMYTDFERKHWIGEFPRVDEAGWARLESLPLDSFRRSMIDFAPTFLRSEADGFSIRTVFGLDALAEKITVLEGGWDDRVVELLKLRLLLLSGRQLHPAHRPRVHAVEDDEVHIWFPPSPVDGDAVVITTTREEADALARDPGWRPVLAELAAGPYVDVGRLMIGGQAGGAPPAVAAATR